MTGSAVTRSRTAVACSARQQANISQSVRVLWGNPATNCFPHGTRLIPAHSEPVTRFGVPILKKKQDEIWTVLNLQVSDRQVEIAVSGGPLTKAEIGLIKDYLAVQERIAPSEREPCPP